MHKWQWFLPWFGQCLLHIVVTSFGQGLHSTPLKWSKDQTWVPQMSSLYQYPFVRNLHKLKPLTPYKNDYNKKQSRDGRRNIHKSTMQQQHAHKQKERAHESKQQSYSSRMCPNLSLTNQQCGRKGSEL
jgi:hypothetical protein